MTYTGLELSQKLINNNKNNIKYMTKKKKVSTKKKQNQFKWTKKERQKLVKKLTNLVMDSDGFYIILCDLDNDYLHQAACNYSGNKRAATIARVLADLPEPLRTKVITIALLQK